MKRISADGSVGSPHVRVGHCQVPIRETRLTAGFLLSAQVISYHSGKLTGQTNPVPRAHFCDPICAG